MSRNSLDQLAPTSTADDEVTLPAIPVSGVSSSSLLCLPSADDEPERAALDATETTESSSPDDDVADELTEVFALPLPAALSDLSWAVRSSTSMSSRIWAESEGRRARRVKVQSSWFWMKRRRRLQGGPLAVSGRPAVSLSSSPSYVPLPSPALLGGAVLDIAEAVKGVGAGIVEAARDACDDDDGPDVGAETLLGAVKEGLSGRHGEMPGRGVGVGVGWWDDW